MPIIKNIDEAIIKAKDYFNRYITIEDYSIEEVEKDQKNEVWQITFGYLDANLSTRLLQSSKTVKVFTIRANDGELVSIKNKK